MTILRQQFMAHVAQTSPSPLTIEVARAEGVFFYTPPTAEHPEGERFFDLISGVSVSNVGHGNPEVVEAVQKQAAEYMHTMVYGEMMLSPQVALATCLAGLLPPRLQSVFFVNSGAEAIEGALKLAKRATGRREILAFRRAYHGSTHGSLSVMSSPEGDAWRAPFEPLLPQTDWLTFNDFAGLARISEKTACVLVEPVQGEAGVRLPAPGFLAALRRRCDETGALLIFDEIQTGMGRTGTLFAFERAGNSEPSAAVTSGTATSPTVPTTPTAPAVPSDRAVDTETSFRQVSVIPDILCVAKAFGGGMPLGAFVSSREIMSTLSHDPALGHITTFGGHPVCCSAGLAALEFLLRESPEPQDNPDSQDNPDPFARNLLSTVEPKGALFESLLENHPTVKEIRRAGLLMAVEFGDAAKMYRLMELFRERGIVSDWFLFCDTAFRISPPLTITEAEIRECCAIIHGCLDELL